MHEIQQENERTRVILVGIDTGEYDTQQSMEELAELADTAGCEVIATAIQSRPAPESATCIGAGKLEEIAEQVKLLEADMLIFDLELTGMQMRNISDAADCKVIDRTMLILDIFAGRARTREGKIQVSLAQYKYRMTRLTGMGSALSRLGGGIGTRGPGETKLETDRRHIRSRVAQLEKELREMEQHRKFISSRRKKDGILTVAIVGYTNAGKSTLFNMLTDAGVLAENKLFATLDVTARALELPDGRTVLLSDTVGLIRRLPHHLVEAFRSTLEETAQADLILHVLDASEPDVQDRMRITQELLNDLGCAEIPQIHVLNKADLVDVPKQSDLENVWISAKHGDGLDSLMKAIVHGLPQTAMRMKLCIPYSEGSFLQLLREEGKLFSEEYTADGTLVDIMVDVKRQKKAKEFAVTE
ncbi:MAG: GTPase HflX [Oscillospiraceae bacterium]|nr:GTPase HflX [Oscillospiraceae bacterium]MBR6617284.1 GTPase HflX [Oscillospiraceae bacterium]